MTQSEFEAGAGQWIVVYRPDDIGVEIDPVSLYDAIAKDATSRLEAGQRMVSMATVPLRHSGVVFGGQGSGYETKVAIAVVYATA
jgi:hypothetical protein